jgi:hypothetical protein
MYVVNILKLFTNIFLILQSKILRLNLKKKFKNQSMQFEVAVMTILECSFLEHSQGILRLSCVGLGPTRRRRRTMGP